jgi:hypothetical protein
MNGLTNGWIEGTVIVAGSDVEDERCPGRDSVAGDMNEWLNE